MKQVCIIVQLKTSDILLSALGQMFNALILETSVIEALTISRILKCNKFYLEHFSSVKTFLSARDQNVAFFFPIISFVV